ncbi:MAG: histidinol dehydrogenase [Phycisphaerales bacterium]|nr:histidinol dehydrogenase [Phycisphaerales bacterium]
MLQRRSADDIARRSRVTIDAPTLHGAQAILDEVRSGGEAALRRVAERLGDIKPAEPLVLDRAAIAKAAASVPREHIELLERTASRIRAFAQSQRDALRPIDVTVPAGRAGHFIAPMDAAGCYAPGGRYPLPSSVLMTAITARVAGVRTVVVASPKPAPITIAAAHVAGADMLLAVGGAQAVGAMAFGIASTTRSIPRCDVIVGPGNRWVTAAKKLVQGEVAIDMLAGPSELLIIADDSADPATVAADLLAQAEHDTDAVPTLVTTSESLATRVIAELDKQLATLPTAATARAALNNGGFVLASSIDDAIAIADRVAPEHLQVMTRDARAVAERLQHYGAVFIGSRSAEIFGDYGVGPNHVLPTAGTARFSAGLSVFHFLRIRTWLEMNADAGEVARAVNDAAALARLEGLEAHARAAEQRLR